LTETIIITEMITIFIKSPSGVSLF
jgi:hypothetical protein